MHPFAFFFRHRAPLSITSQRRCVPVLAGLLLAVLGCRAACWAGELAGPYTDPRHLTLLRFGVHSHWAQPWRAYLETVPAHRFLNALGMGLDLKPEDNADLVARMLARCGIRHARIEAGWGHVDFDDETKLANAAELERLLRACQRHGIRPLILLNGHHGAPCPIRFFERELAADARRGDTRVRLADAGGLVPGRSGFCNLTDYWACEVLVTGVDGDTVTLSRPLPKDLGKAGTRVLMATLKYRPFSVPGSADYQETLSAWQRYAGTVARFAARVLGTTAAPDRGFDLEIWNELSFGSHFLWVNHYYEPKLADYREDDVWGAIVDATAAYAEAHPEDFRGVTLCDGFGNTIPWRASGLEPARVAALSHHPYAGRKTYPQDEQRGEALNALFQVEQPGFVPAYSVAFPEYFATALQTETAIRDMAPITTDIYGVPHGRYARLSRRQGGPCTTWFTEVGTAPNEIGVKDPAAALRLKAKTTARYYCFYVNKGVERLYLYAAAAGDAWLGIVSDRFLKYARTSNAYPRDDRPFLSPALRTLARIVTQMKAGLDPALARPRPLKVLSVRDNHDHIQFRGDGTPAHPSLYNRDVLAILPYQVNARRFVIPYYVMTRHVTRDLPPEEYTITLDGLRGTGATVKVYDPIADRVLPVAARTEAPDRLTLTLMATDSPRLLIIQERAPARPLPPKARRQ